MTGYATEFDENETMSFRAKKCLLKNYNKIWEKVDHIDASFLIILLTEVFPMRNCSASCVKLCVIFLLASKSLIFSSMMSVFLLREPVSWCFDRTMLKIQQEL